MQEPNKKSVFVAAFFALLVASIGGGVYGFAKYQALSVALVTERDAAFQQKTNFENTILRLEASSTELRTALASSTEENRSLSERLGIIVEDNSSLSQQVVSSQHHIEILDKLRNTDKELLQKYSKVFFLNENYTPSALATITPDFVYDKKKSLLIHADVRPFLERMMREAAASSHPLTLISAYRSYKEQTSLKSAYSMTFGAGANKFSADQGYSEHQLGTTIDLTTPALGSNFANFAASGAYAWMTENAYKFGFILSYPKNNSYYVYEPWHWRFVGVVLAAKLHQDGRNFYDLDQRDIDAYLIDIFTLKEAM